MELFYVTFGLGSPFKDCFGIVKAENEFDVRKYLAEWVGKSWAGLYRPNRFHQHELKKIFEITLWRDVADTVRIL